MIFVYWLVVIIFCLLFIIGVMFWRLRKVERSLDHIRVFNELAAGKLADFALWRESVKLKLESHEEDIGKLYVLHELPAADLPHKKDDIL